MFDKLASYFENSKMVSFQEFVNFLVNEQKDPLGYDKKKVTSFMCDFLKVENVIVKDKYHVKFFLGSSTGRARTIFYSIRILRFSFLQTERFMGSFEGRCLPRHVKTVIPLLDCIFPQYVTFSRFLLNNSLNCISFQISHWRPIF